MYVYMYGTYVIPYISMIYLSGALPQVWARDHACPHNALHSPSNKPIVLCRMVTACKLLPKSLYFSSCPDAECSVLIGQILAEYGLVACYNAVKCLA